MSSICRRWIDTNKMDETLTEEFFRLFYQTTEHGLRSNGDICIHYHQMIVQSYFVRVLTHGKKYLVKPLSTAVSSIVRGSY